MQFLIRNDEVQDNLIKHLNEIREKGGIPFVEVGNKKDTRRNAQNRLMQQWFSDIDKKTGHGVIYESGRCKMRYFLPLMRHSQDQKCLDQIEFIEWIYRTKRVEGGEGYAFDYLVEKLGSSHIESTRLLSVKLFAQALTNMQEGEAKEGIILTNPNDYGWVV